MTEVTVTTRTWKEELASLVEDTGINHYYGGDDEAIEMNKTNFVVVEDDSDVIEEPLKDQVKEFLKASGEMVLQLGKGCRDIVLQSFGNEVKFVVKKCEDNWDKFSRKLSFLNDYLPEDRDPAHAWPIVFFVFFIALSVLLVNTESQSPKILPKEVYLHPPSASRVQLPDGRHLAYHEQGVSADSVCKSPMFWYVERGVIVAEGDSGGGDAYPLSSSNGRHSIRREEKWWLPCPKVPHEGLSEDARKRLQQCRDCTNQILKAALAINSSVLCEMEVPSVYLDTLPKIESPSASNARGFCSNHANPGVLRHS